jgi:uncharacterized protein (DUF4415 family)
MKKTYVKYTIDLDNPPPLTEDEKKQIEALRNMRDEDIDYSDIPRLTEDFWKNAKPFRDSQLFRPRKESTTVRLDADILAWLKLAGPGYQTRINSILRSVMMKEEKK